MTAFRRLDGFSPDEYTALTGKPLPREITTKLREKADEGLITSENGLLRLSEKGIFLADRVIYDIVEPFL
jgi:coproporphyrinogen III oxidase-like Fe-S oxidoreductase